MSNYISLRFTKHMRILWQAQIFPNKHYDTIFVKIHPYLEKL